MRSAVAVVLLVVIALLIVKLAAAPLYARYSADECLQAYAEARTRADSVRVDLHPFMNGRQGIDHRCGEVRSRRAANAADVPMLGQPN